MPPPLLASEEAAIDRNTLLNLVEQAYPVTIGSEKYVPGIIFIYMTLPPTGACQRL
jgi:hypothetical protein